MSKILEIHFRVKKAIVVVSDNNLIGLASSLKLNGFKPKSKIVYQNLNEEQLAELLGIVFPPKKTRKDEVWERILKDINTDDSLFCKSPTLTEALSKKEIVNKLSEMADDAPCYTIKRQPTFFARETKVSYNQLKEIFTDKAITAMVEEGYLETGVKPKSFLDYYHEQLAKDIREQTERYEKFTDEAIEKGLKGECGGGLFPSQTPKSSRVVFFDSEGIEPVKISGENPGFLKEPFLGVHFKEELDTENLKGINKIIEPFNSKIKIKLDKKHITDNNVCELLENNIRLYQPNEKLDIYLSKSLYKELCEKFGGKVKKYKGHNIIVS